MAAVLCAMKSATAAWHNASPIYIDCVRAKLRGRSVQSAEECIPTKPAQALNQLLLLLMAVPSDSPVLPTPRANNSACDRRFGLSFAEELVCAA